MPVLPAAAALEIMADAARSLWPGWKVVETRDFRLIKGVEMKEAGARAAGRHPAAALRQQRRLRGRRRDPLRARRRPLAGPLPLPSFASSSSCRASSRARPRFARRPRQLSVATAYDELLFHGPCFQVIEAIDGLSERGSVARVRRIAARREWLAGMPEAHDQWIFDPALVDAAAQMALLWARSLRGESCLPARFGRIVRLRETLPRADDDGVRAASRCADPSLVRANVYFLDAAGQVVLLIEEMECIASAALNRLGGTAAKGAAALPA